MLNTNMSITLSNGMVLSGTESQLRDALGKLGMQNELNQYYLSSTHGLVKISEMDTNHIRNALLKMERNHFDVIQTAWGAEFVTAISHVPTDPVFFALLAEYTKRTAKKSKPALADYLFELNETTGLKIRPNEYVKR